MRTLLLILITIPSLAQSDLTGYVNAFYDDAYAHHALAPVKKIEVRVATISNANGKSTRLEDGSILLVIDHDFYNYYFGKSQVKRLVYFLLAHDLLGLEKSKGNTVMNEERVYKPLRDKHIDQMFKAERWHTSVPDEVISLK